MLWPWILGNTAALYGLSLVASRTLPDRDTGSDEFVEHPEKASASLSEPFEASFGVNISNIYNIDLASSSFYLEGYAWMKWKDKPEWLKEWDQEVYQCPAKSISFINAVNRHNVEISLEPSNPVEDDDGRMIQWLGFSGTFVANELDLRMFPFEEITLPLEIELDDFYAGEAKVEYKQSGPILTTAAAINGYNFANASVRSCTHIYQTNWGYEYSRNYFGRDNYTEFIAFIVSTRFRRNTWNSCLNIFLPLTIVMAVVLASPLVAIQDYQTKLAIPASALLVLVFLQESYKKILPPGLNYPTLADLIYTYSMFITISTFLWSLFRTKAYLAVEAALSGGKSRWAWEGLDNVYFIANLGFFIVGPWILYKFCKLPLKRAGNQRSH